MRLFKPTPKLEKASIRVPFNLHETFYEKLRKHIKIALLSVNYCLLGTCQNLIGEFNEKKFIFSIL